LPLDLPGRSWFSMFESDGDFIEPKQGERRRMDGVSVTRRHLEHLLEVLESKGWHRRDIFFLGFSQGAITAVDLAIHSKERFGGVVAVSGTLLPEDEVRAVGGKTPILVTHGLRDDQEPIGGARKQVQRLKKAVGEGAPVLFKEFKKGHEMINSEVEMRVVMEFFAQHLDLVEHGDEDGEMYEISNGMAKVPSGMANVH